MRIFNLTIKHLNLRFLLTKKQENCKMSIQNIWNCVNVILKPVNVILLNGYT